MQDSVNQGSANNGRKNGTLAIMKAGSPRQYKIGTAYPKTVRLRLAWGRSAPRGQAQDDNTINIPLDTRTQTILSYRLPPEQRAMVNGMDRPQIRSRLELDHVLPADLIAFQPFIKYLAHPPFHNVSGLSGIRVDRV